jgi:hypothetical protein
LFALGVLSVPAAARADFSVSPTIVEFGRAPGRVAVGTVEVRLQGEGAERFAVDVEDVSQTRGGTFAFGPPRNSRFSASRWITLSPARFRGTPDRVQPVQFTVRVPADAEPGDHVTALTVKRLSRAVGGTTLVQAVAVRLTVRVRGRLRPAAALLDLRVLRISGGSTVAGRVTVRNTGNVRLNFDRDNPGALRVLRSGHVKAALPFRGPLYPGEERAFRLTWADPPLFGHFDMRGEVRANRLLKLSQGFWVVPWRQAIALALIAFAAGLLIAGRRRRTA